MTPLIKILPHERNRFDDALPFKMDGVYCKLIPLTQGYYAIVTEVDHALLSTFRWYALKIRGKPYAARKTGPRSSHRTILMHRQILELDFGNPLQGDHCNLDSLDNRRSNLRIATDLQNRYNTVARRNNSSGFKGVSRDKNAHPSHPWRARITVNGQELLIGNFATPEAANNAYRDAARRYFGKFSRSD
jgi:hypothetical protein